MLIGKLTVALFLVLAAMPILAVAQEETKTPPMLEQKETVVLLHGIGHSRWNMYWVERAMHKVGYEVVNLTYPSTKKKISGLSEFVKEELASRDVWNKAGKVHFVTHSMGGLVTQYYLDRYQSDIPKEKMGRVVMLAPPNGGSEVADFLEDFLPYQWSFGPAGQELTTSVRAESKVIPYYELGIIAGKKRWPYFVANFVLKNDHDGRVKIEKTKMDGMKDHIVISATHSFISWKPLTHRQIVTFLKNGEFKK